MKTVDTTLIFDPDSYEALLQGWSLHVRKQREKHDLAATRYDWYNRLLSGVVAVNQEGIGTLYRAIIFDVFCNRSKRNIHANAASKRFAQVDRMGSGDSQAVACGVSIHGCPFGYFLWIVLGVGNVIKFLRLQVKIRGH